MRSTGSRSTKTTESTPRAIPGQKFLCWAKPIWAATQRLSSTRRPVLLPALSVPARPGLLLLTGLLLSLLCLVMAIPRRTASGVAVEGALLGDLSSSRDNITSAETPVRAPEATEGSPAATLAAVLESLAPPPPEPASLPSAELPRRLTEESSPIIQATALEPVPEDCYPVRDPHQGDTPMMRTWKMLGLNTLLAALFAAAPGLGSNTSGPLTDAEKLDEIQKQLNELKSSLAEVKKTLVDTRTDSTLGTQRLQGQINDLNNQVAQLLDSMRNRGSTSVRIAAAPALDTVPVPGTARIELANTYSQSVSVIINNLRSYPLQPGERRLSDPVPAGSFTYEVLGITPKVTRTIAADTIFTVWVHPQP